MAFRARRSFVFAHPDRRFRVRVGDAFPDKHPAVVANPHLFESIDEVEQATSAPGEKRQLSKSSRQAKARAKAASTPKGEKRADGDQDGGE